MLREQGKTGRRMTGAVAAAATPPWKRRVLVADDLPSIHEDFRKILAGGDSSAEHQSAEDLLLGRSAAGVAHSDFHVDFVLQGAEALRRVEQALEGGAPYALAFVDLRMPPGWDGVETIRRLWQADPALQVVICSAYSDYTQAELCRRLGKRDQFLFLRKPFDPMEVLQLASALTEKWRLQRDEQQAVALLERRVEERTEALRDANRALAAEVADRVQRERELRRSEERMRATVDSALDCIISMDASGRITEFNAAAERTFGFTRKQVIGQFLAETIVPPARRQAHTEGVSRHAAGHGRGLLGRRIETTAVRADGMEIPVELAITCVGAGSGAIYTGFLRDITERRRGETEIARANRSLRMIGECNQAVIHAAGELALLSEICRIAVDVGGYRVAGVGYVLDGRSLRIRNAASYGDDSGFIAELDSQGFPLDDGPAGKAIRSGEPFVVPDLHAASWKFDSLEPALRRGYRSAISLPLRNGKRCFGVLGLCSTEVFDGDGAELRLLCDLADNLAFGIDRLRARAEQAQAERQRGKMERELAKSLARQQWMSRRLVEARELEQQKLSAELHDRIGQDLTALSINLEIIDETAPPQLGPKLSARLQDSRRLLDRTIASVRDVIAELRPAALDDYGLLAGLRGYGEQLQRRAGIAIVVDGQEPPERLAAPVEDALFRIAQEALTNTVKHARARTATVQLECGAAVTRLTIADDGAGFDADAVERRWPHSSWGLQLMRERAQAVGAAISITSQPAHGTRVIVELQGTPP